MDAKEEWRDVVEFEGLYQISNLGRVKRIGGGGAAVIGRVLRPRTQGAGYQSVALYNRAGTRHNFLVHRLVLEAFIGLDPVRPYANHKNGDRSRNFLHNLEWVTAKENTADAIRRWGKHWNSGRKRLSAYRK